MEPIVFIAFEIFKTPVLAVMCLLLCAIYLWKWKRYLFVVPRGRNGYLVKSMNWIVFATAFAVFPVHPIETGRAMLRISTAMLLLSEIAYNAENLKLIILEAISWTRTLISRR